MPTVTVIIPVYNNIKTLEKCVDSVIGQTYADLEIILADDGSTDSSEKLCDKYRESDSRVVVLHAENKGVAYARNQGMKIARGKYIAFVDADDHIVPEYIEKLVSVMEKENCLLAMCNAYDVYEDHVGERIFSREGSCSANEFLTDMFYCRAEGGTCWGKLFRTEDIRNVFRKYNYAEDVLFVFEYLSAREGSVYVIPEFLYYYVRRKDSITGVKKISDLRDVIGACGRIRKLCKDDHPELLGPADSFLINNSFFVYLNSKHDLSTEGDRLRNAAKKIIRKLRLKILLDRNATFKTKAACLISMISYKLLSRIYGMICIHR
ncbi:MAG: glycosyltransferase [Lachnospiraceae bacterium]|nr:glycosyltransferase [Lachnospiraceae bacterium]